MDKKLPYPVQEPRGDGRLRKGRQTLRGITEGAMGHVQYETDEGGDAGLL